METSKMSDVDEMIFQWLDKLSEKSRANWDLDALKLLDIAILGNFWRKWFQGLVELISCLSLYYENFGGFFVILFQKKARNS